MRKLIAVVRRMILGPTLDRLSRLTNTEVHNLLHLTSEDPVMGLLKASAASGAAVASGNGGGVMVNEAEIRQLIQDLRTQQAVNQERIAVLETVYQRLTHSGGN